MARFTGNRNKIARKFGVNIFGRNRNPLLHKQNLPGQHGARRRKRSDYGLQLEEKQKLKAVYGMLSEKQLIRYFKEAEAEGGKTPELLAQRLECRLDNIVWRLKFGSTIFAAHQLVSHGHILVNGKKVDRRSFLVKPGMVISIKEGSRSMKAVQEATQNPNRSVAEYLSVDENGMSGKLITVPSLEQISWPVEIDLHEVCDFIAHEN